MDRRAFLCAAVAVSVPAVAFAQQPNPHGGGGAGRPRGQGGYQPPEDVVAPSPEVPMGTVVVRIVDADENPIPNTDVSLEVLHQSVALGDSRESKKGTTNEEGFVEFRDLQVGSGHAYQAKTQHQGASFQTTAFGLTRDGGGVAVILHVYEASAKLDDTMVFTPDARVFLTLKDDVIVVTYEALLANPSPTAWLAEYSLLLPPGFKAFTSEEDSVPSLIPTDDGVLIKGTVAPGGAVIRFRFHVPHHNDSDVAMSLALPPRTTRILLAAEASKKMGLSAEGFPKEAERVKDRGRTLLKLEKQWTPRDGENFFPKVNLKLTGLPTRGLVPWVAAGLAASATVGAVLYAWSRRDKPAVLSADSRDDLLEAKEAMLEEIVALERSRERGEVGPRAYERLRRAMLDALARIVDKLEANPAPPAKQGPYRVPKQPAVAAPANDTSGAGVGWDSPLDDSPKVKPAAKPSAEDAAAPVKKKKMQRPTEPSEDPPKKRAEGKSET